MAKASLCGRPAKDASTEQGLCGRSRSASSLWTLRFVTIAFYPTGSRTAAVVTFGYTEVRTAVFRGLNSYLRSILTASVVAGRNPGLKSETWATHFLLCGGR
jgi:hypothetical protein